MTVNCPYYKNVKCPYIDAFCKLFCIDCLNGIQL